MLNTFNSCTCSYVFLYTVYFGVNMRMSSLSCIQGYISKMKLVETLKISIKKTNLENQLHISKESPEKSFRDTVFKTL